MTQKPLTLNITFPINATSFDDYDNHLLQISNHLSDIINATNADPQSIIDFIYNHIKIIPPQ